MRYFVTLWRISTPLMKRDIYTSFVASLRTLRSRFPDDVLLRPVSTPSDDNYIEGDPFEDDLEDGKRMRRIGKILDKFDPPQNDGKVV